MAQKAIIIALPQQDGKTVMYRALNLAPIQAAAAPVQAAAAPGEPPRAVCVPPAPAAEIDVESMDDDDYYDQDDLETASPRKRARLTHLSPEEKLNRRKLRNRIAAQTARDRKKEQFCAMEIRMKAMESENKRLRVENEKLRTILKARRTFVVQQQPDVKKHDVKPETVSSGCQTEPPSKQALESAALISAPQQQGQAWPTAFLTSLLLTCLSTPSSTSSKTSSNSNGLQLQPHRQKQVVEEDKATTQAQIYTRINRLNLRHTDKLRLYRILSHISALHTRKKACTAAA